MENSLSRSLPLKKVHVLYPIFAITLCACFLFYKYVLQIYPSIVTEQLMSEFKLNGLGLGHLAATFYYTYTVTQLFVGVLLDRYGTRYLTAFAILICALGALYFSQAYNIFGAELSRGAMGVGVAFATVAYMKIAATWFPPRHYAFVGGLLATAAMLGAAFGQAPVALLIDHLGWRMCLFIVGCAGLVLTILFFAVVRDVPTTVIEKRASFRDVLQVIKSKQNWLLAAYAGLAFSPVAVFGGLWGNPFLQQAYHVTKTEASLLLTCIFIGMGVGSPIMGLLSDCLGRRINIMLYGTGAACFFLSLVLYAYPMPVVIVGLLLFLMGFTLGSFMLVFVVGKETNSLLMTATVVAMINATDAAFDSIAEPFIGKLLDLNWDGTVVNGAHYFSLSNYQISLAILPLFLGLGTMLLFFVKGK